MAAACQTCEGRGFLWNSTRFANNLHVVKRCIKCKRFDSDQAAARRICATSSDFYAWGVIRSQDDGVLTIVVIKSGD